METLNTQNDTQNTFTHEREPPKKHTLRATHMCDRRRIPGWSTICVARVDDKRQWLCSNIYIVVSGARTGGARKIKYIKFDRDFGWKRKECVWWFARMIGARRGEGEVVLEFRIPRRTGDIAPAFCEAIIITSDVGERDLWLWLCRHFGDFRWRFLLYYLCTDRWRVKILRFNVLKILSIVHILKILRTTEEDWSFLRYYRLTVYFSYQILKG